MRYRRPRQRNSDDEFWPAPFGPGSATPASGSPTAGPEHPAAALWLPNPEQRHGWELYLVEKERQPAARGPLGYRRQ